MEDRTAVNRWSELLAGVRRGDPRCGEALFRALAPAALKVAERMTGETHLAEDVVQETFLSAIRSLETLQDERSFRSWFFAILVNRSREVLRSRKIRKETAAQESVPAPEPPASEGFARAVAEFQEALPTLERELFRRVVLERESYESAASALGVTVEVVRTRVYRLRKRLREEWRRVRGGGNGDE